MLQKYLVKLKRWIKMKKPIFIKIHAQRFLSKFKILFQILISMN